MRCRGLVGLQLEQEVCQVAHIKVFAGKGQPVQLVGVFWPKRVRECLAQLPAGGCGPSRAVAFIVKPLEAHCTPIHAFNRV